MFRGGVETAIEKTYRDLNKIFDYRVFYIKSYGEINVNQKSFLLILFSMIFKKDKSELILTSLWWSHPFGYWLSKIGYKWVVFIHSPKFSSFFDRVITKFALKNANFLFFDSNSTHKVFNKTIKGKFFFIPFVFEKVSSKETLNYSTKYDFSWIGRNSKEKRIDLFINFLNRLERKKSNAKVLVIISGKKSIFLESYSKKLKNIELDFFYNISYSKVNELLKQSKINLCFSDYEGFSVSSFQAINKGNILGSRKVGEIINYAKEENHVFLKSLSKQHFETFIDSLIYLVNNQDVLDEMRLEAHNNLEHMFGNKSYLSSITKSFKEIFENQ